MNQLHIFILLIIFNNYIKQITSSISIQNSFSTIINRFALLNSIPKQNSTNNKVIFKNNNKVQLPLQNNKDDDIDVSLYSRQLFVYGKSSQQKLKSANVLIIGNNDLTNEIAKNIALCGIGKISIFENHVMSNESHVPQIRSLRGDPSISLYEYTKSINAYNQVQDLSHIKELLSNETLFKSYNFTSVISTNQDFTNLKQLNHICKLCHTLLIACNIYGNCGYIFNDFQHNFVIEDIDGETYKEIPLSTEVSIMNKSLSNRILLKVAVIYEENIGFGINEHVEIITNNNNNNKYRLKVNNIIDKRTCVLELKPQEEEDENNLIDYIKTGKATIQKIKSKVVINHQSLLLQLLKPSFCPSNECLSAKKDYAISITLLACIKVYEHYMSLYHDQNNTKYYNILSNHDLFRTAVMEELKTMGIINPELNIKQKGLVGSDILDYVLERYRTTAMYKCPITASMIGAMASQEVIKSITHMYAPINQFLMFESLNAIIPTTSSSLLVLNKNNSITSSNCYNLASFIYSNDVIEELKKLKVFVIGSGAIGCELLKNFALIGIGEATDTHHSSCSITYSEINTNNTTQTCYNTTNMNINNIQPNEINHNNNKDKSNHRMNSLWNIYNISHGGILITDMDNIERSNLNRQLLFREQHIGQSKSLVAAEQIKKMNPYLQVVGITNKLSIDTEHVFNSTFWNDTDIIATALDNVDARKYVDEQVVRYSKWMVDSGTLGTKGNTQVIVPYLTESYSSSADPPEDAIPLCTLKSFPYQSDHCVSWAKSLFEESFVKESKLLQTCLQYLINNNSSNNNDLIEWYDKLTDDDKNSLNKIMKYMPWDINELVRWSMDEFNSLYHDSIIELIKQHPINEVDEEGTLFWGGARRFPHSIDLNLIDNQIHQQFILQLTNIRSRVLGNNHIILNDKELNNIILKKSIINDLINNNNNNSIHSIISKWYSLSNDVKTNIINNQLPNIHIEEFEKDDLSLGHVDYIMSMSNLRCQVYSLPMLDRLQVQKIAGNIIPALATTTALVAGLVTIEIIKIAMERVLHKRSILLQEQEQQELLEPMSSRNTVTRSTSKTLFKNIFQKSSSIQKSKTIHYLHSDVNNVLLMDKLLDKDYLKQHQNRLLSIFRNSFVNLARPMLAFAQPIECTEYPYTMTISPKDTIIDNPDLLSTKQPYITYNLWDAIEVPFILSEVTIKQLNDYLITNYQVSIQSLSYMNHLLYADFLSEHISSATTNNNDDDNIMNQTIDKLLIEAMIEDENIDINSRDGDVDTHIANNNELFQMYNNKLLNGKDFLIFDTSYSKHSIIKQLNQNNHNHNHKIVEEYEEEEVDIKLPPLKIYIHNHTKQLKTTATANNNNFKTKIKNKLSEISKKINDLF